ncbi:MAG: hypothetical protein ACYDB8_00720 [Acidiferrobacterales bacterium]
MRKIEEIEPQIEALSGEELAELRDWFLEQDWNVWDVQVAADVQAGKRDTLISEAKSELDRRRIPISPGRGSACAGNFAGEGVRRDRANRRPQAWTGTEAAIAG